MYKELLKQHEEILKKLTDKASGETNFEERGQFMNIQKMIQSELYIIEGLNKADELIKELDESLDEIKIVEEDETDIFKRELHSYQGVKYLIGQRGCGHTYSAIKVSAEKQIPILVHNKVHVNLVANQAKKLGYDIPTPLSMDDTNFYNRKKDSKLIIDDSVFFFSAISDKLKKCGINSEDVEFINVSLDDEYIISQMTKSDKEFVDGFKELEELVKFN